jgi:hypothetical protein
MKQLYSTILLSAALCAPAHAITSLSLQLGEPWDNAAASAIAEWNAVLPLLSTDPGSVNVIRWDATLTTTASTVREPGRTLVNLNPAVCFELYEGPQEYGFCHGKLEVFPDLKRVVLHELGHVLGLPHAAEGTDAIMHAETTDRAELSPDDEARLLALPRASTTVQSAHGSTGGGCTMGGEKDGGLFFLIISLFFVGSLKFWRRVVDTYSRVCRRVR